MRPQLVPKHVAIIMDGNRRWAKERGWPVIKGHRAGAEALERVVEAAGKLGISYLTVFALSTENLRNRSKSEVSFLFSLMETFIKEKIPELDKKGVRLEFIGDLHQLPINLQRSLSRSKEKLSHNKKITLVVAINYGGRAEITAAVKKIDKDKEKITQEDINANLYTVGLPDPDLIIRTGGMVRLSNFLLWQAAYSEFYFTKTLWPDFDGKGLTEAVEEFKKRVRNFGR